MRRILILFAALGLGSTLAFSGAPFWQKKDYNQWSKKECETLLSDSPWAKTFRTGYSSYAVQLRSALPIRQAVIRQLQIEEKYESLSAERRLDFDKRAENLLSRQLFTENIVVRLTGAIFTYRMPAPPEEFRHTVSLITSSNEKIPPLQYLRLVDGFDFLFPRQYKGRLLVDPSSKFLRFEFPYSGVTASSPDFNTKSGLWGAGVALIEFRVGKMLVNGRLTY
jgi:hypothetical protein